MKNLIVIRHAKSSWDDSALDDHARSLNQRGLRVAPLMGQQLVARGVVPDVIVSSTATRARSTAALIANAIGYVDEDIVEKGQIYNASKQALLQVLREIDESHASAILVGHVPGVQELTNALCADAGIGHYPTCGIALIQLDIEFWGEIDPGVGKLVEFLAPKEILEPGVG